MAPIEDRGIWLVSSTSRLLPVVRGQAHWSEDGASPIPTHEPIARGSEMLRCSLRGVYPEPIRYAQGKLREWAQGDRPPVR